MQTYTKGRRLCEMEAEIGVVHLQAEEAHGLLGNTGSQEETRKGPSLELTL